MKLPSNADEGSLPRKIVIDVLKEHDVEIQDLGENKYRLFDGSELEVQILHERVMRFVIQRLSKRFQIDMTSFYYDTLIGKRREDKL